MVETIQCAGTTSWHWLLLSCLYSVWAVYWSAALIPLFISAFNRNETKNFIPAIWISGIAFIAAPLAGAV